MRLTGRQPEHRLIGDVCRLAQSLREPSVRNVAICLGDDRFISPREESTATTLLQDAACALAPGQSPDQSIARPDNGCSLRDQSVSDFRPPRALAAMVPVSAVPRD